MNLSTATLAVPLATAMLIGPAQVTAQPADLPIQHPSGLSVGAAYFVSGVGFSVVFDHLLRRDEGIAPSLVAWSAYLPGGGLAGALSVRAGSGVVRGGLGLGAFRSDGRFTVGPGVQVGIGTRPSAGSMDLRGTFEAWLTTEGYVPVLSVHVGRVPIGKRREAS